MATDCTRHWIQFFTGCGIPEDVAAIYGLIFNENRIQKNMLLDLNKEYLRDMGITVMGDVIAILRHAKVVHDNQVREQILHEPIENDEDIHLLDDNQTKDLNPMKRMLEHYTRKYEADEMSIAHEKVQISVNNEKNILKKKAQNVSMNKKIDAELKIEKLKLRQDNLLSKSLKSSIGRLKRVSPEIEENYKINMTSKATEKPKRLAEKAMLKQSKTVFERLGESSVSSTSDVINISGQSRLGKTPVNKEKNTSVFSRLGEKSSLVSSTSPATEAVELSDQLPYKGILKASYANRKLRLSPTIPNSTMRADNELKLSKGNGSINKMESVKERLGKNLGRNESSSQNVGAKFSRLKITFDSAPARTSRRTGQQIILPDEEQTQVHTLSNRFKSIKGAGESSREKKNILDGIANYRYENTQNRSAVTSTTQSPELKHRNLKRRLGEAEPVAFERDEIEATQSKKVRFGRTTERLIPPNSTDFRVIQTKENSNLTMTVLNGDAKKSAAAEKAKETMLKSGIKVGPLSSDKIRRKVSMKERIGREAPGQREMRSAIADVKKNPPDFVKRLKKGTSNVHDRLG